MTISIGIAEVIDTNILRTRWPKQARPLLGKQQAGPCRCVSFKLYE